MGLEPHPPDVPLFLPSTPATRYCLGLAVHSEFWRVNERVSDRGGGNRRFGFVFACGGTRSKDRRGDAKLIIASAYLPLLDDARAADVLRDESYKVTGSAPIYEILHTAKERAHAPARRTSRSARSSAPRWTRW